MQGVSTVVFSVLLLAAGTPALTKGVTLQIHGVGPSGMTMAEPAKK
jgi:hypothetical protein